jgi:Putative DNA-binding domain
MLNLQELLGQYILKEEKSPELLKSLIPGGRLTQEAALKVYRNDYVARLTTVLGENYEAVWTVLGDELFFMVCEEFIKNNNSKSFDIGEFGGEFHLFLKNHKLGSEFPFLGDLAFFEKNFLRIFHSPLQESSSMTIKEQDPFNLRFKFTEGIHLQKSPYPIFKLWELKNTPSEKRHEVIIDWSEPSNLVLYKNNLGIRTSFFKEGQLDILSNLLEGKKLSESLPENITPAEVEEVFRFISSSGILLEII